MRIIWLESKRVMNRMALLGFLAFVLVVSAYYSHRNLLRYDQVGTWKDTLQRMRNISEGLSLDEKCIKGLVEDKSRYGYPYSDDITEMIVTNYGKFLEDLSEKEMKRFFQVRAERICENLLLDEKKGYTDAEIKKIMEQATALSALSLGYASGWKILVEKMGNYVLFLLVVISALLLPLFGRDTEIKMEEMVCTTRHGRRRLSMARMAAAYLTATILYFVGMAVHFVAVMLPFGLDGAGQPIQSNLSTFFSLYNITYARQFLWNLLRGYVALIFMVSLVLMVTILIKNILASGSVIAIFIVTLLIFNQITLYPVNHWFANFMPVRMTDGTRFFVENELYRIGGASISCMSFSIVVSLALSVFFLAGSLIVLHVQSVQSYR